MKKSLITYLSCGLVLLGGLFAVPVYAEGKFLAAIITGNLERYRSVHEAFEKALYAGGVDPGQVQIYVQAPNPDPGSWKNSIRKAIGVGADLIITYGAPATLSAIVETEKIPIVYGDVYDPLGLNIATENHLPKKKNASGAGSNTPVETLLKTLTQIQQPRKIGILYTEFDQGSLQQMRELERLSFKYHFTVEKREVKTLPQVLPELTELLTQVDAFFASDSAPVQMKLDDILARAAEVKIPVISQIPGASDKGALINLEANLAEQGEHVAATVQQLLAGKKINYIPILYPKRVSLVINVGVARDLKMTLPFQVLSTATRIVK